MEPTSLISAEDEKALRRALELARAAAAFASPNPAVGCVLVEARTGAVLGEGAHFYDRRDHAEIAALKQASVRGQDVRGATAYVTLEPCAHHGRTGPCAVALVEAGVARCVVATADPNPLVRGQGMAILRAAGVEVQVVPDASEICKQARRLNDAFAFSIVAGRPFVTLKAAVSVDGMLAPPASAREGRAPVWLTGAEARGDVQRLRHEHDALVTGIGTVLADDPSLTDRTGLPRRRPLLRVVLDGALRTPLKSKLLASARAAGDLLIVASVRAPADKEAALRHAGAEVVRLGEEAPGRLGLGAVLEQLQRLGMRSVMVEAGAAVNASFLRAGLVDRAVLYFSEAEMGPGGVPFAAGWGSAYDLQSRLRGVEREEFARADGRGADVRVSGYVRDPWASIESGTGTI